MTREHVNSTVNSQELTSSDSARHLGAGQPIAADRAALVERMRSFLVRDLSSPCRNHDYCEPEAERLIAAVEAAGWGPRAEPVAGTGETLYRVCPNGCADHMRSASWARRHIALNCSLCDGSRYVRVDPPAGETLYRKCQDCNADGTRKVWEGGDDVCHGCKGRGYVPVAPPEPLSAEEISSIALTAWGASMHGHEISWSSISVADRHRAEVIVRAVLAALPARHAVPVEGA